MALRKILRPLGVLVITSVLLIPAADAVVVRAGTTAAAASAAQHSAHPSPADLHETQLDLIVQHARLVDLAHGLVQDVEESTESSDRLDELTDAALAVADAVIGSRLSDKHTLLPSALLTPREVSEMAIRLQAHETALGTARSSWEEAVDAARSERLEREAALQAEAEAKAARQTAESQQAQQTSPAQAPVQAQPVEPQGPSVDHVLWPMGSGGQAQIDQCAGPVWFAAIPNYLAEHWHCGGAAFPQWSGATISLDGALYTSHGAVVITAYGANASVIPGGYDLYYQTCLDNNPNRMAIFGLTRIRSTS